MNISQSFVVSRGPGVLFPQNFRFLFSTVLCLIKRAVLLFLALSFLSGCGLFHTITPSEVAGEYVYRYKSGEVEVWILRPDLTFQQEFYKTVDDYRKGKGILFKDVGTWSLSMNSATCMNTIITVFDSLNFYDYSGSNHPLTSPDHYFSRTADWYGPDGEQVARIAIAPDIDYLLYRTSDRNQIPQPDE